MSGSLYLVFLAKWQNLLVLLGCLSKTSSEFGLLGKEHHARLIQGSVKLTESEQQVHPQLLVAFGVQGTVFGCCIPVSSLQYKLIGKLLGVGPFI